ncbi:MAG: hypothetical protein CMJ28_07700 [Phycisphaerae bacterium]|nr:hypothetical protein [Phycisphaerae bacterium]
MPPDLRLTNDPRPRLHTPEAVRKANAARLIAAQLEAYSNRASVVKSKQDTQPLAHRAICAAVAAWTFGLMTGILLTQLW